MLCLFGGIGVYNNSVTGNPTIDLSDSLETSFGLIFDVFRGILKPLIGFLGVNEEGYLGMKLLMGIFLFFILFYSLRKTEGKGFLKDLAVPGSIIISLAFVVLIPDTLMKNIFGAPTSVGPFVSFILVLLGLVGTFYIFKYMHKWESKNGFEESAKAIAYFFIFVIISLSVTLFQTSVNGVLPATLLGLLVSFTTLYCLISIGIHFVKAFTIGHLAASKFGFKKIQEYGEVGKQRKEYFSGELNQEIGKIKSDISAFISREKDIISKLNSDGGDDVYISNLLDDLKRIINHENSFLASVGRHGFFSDRAIPIRSKKLTQSYISDLKVYNRDIKIICNNGFNPNVKNELNALIALKETTARNFETNVVRVTSLRP
jgi:hypothetical protein